MRRGWILMAAVAAGVAAAACASSGSGGNGTPTATTPPSSPTPTPPAVASRVPGDGAAGVSLNATIAVTFDHDMNPATLTTASFFARDAGGVLAGTVSYDAPSLTAQFAPAATLPPTTLITMTLTSAVADSEAVPLASTQTWTFTTGSVPDTTPPTFAGITSATDNGDGTATLSWAVAATDDHTPAGSIVYRAYASTNLTTVLAQVVGATSVVSPPIPAGSYSWTVRAFDAAGNHDLNTATASATTTVPAVSFASTIQPIFSANCAIAGCHNTTTKEQGLDLSSGVAYAHIVGVASTEKTTLKLVAPSDAARSYLYQKVTNAPGIVGVRMPENALPLSNTDIAHLREWILDGAPND